MSSISDRINELIYNNKLYSSLPNQIMPSNDCMCSRSSPILTPTIMQDDNLLDINYPTGSHLSITMEHSKIMARLIEERWKGTKYYPQRIKLICSGASGIIYSTLIYSHLSICPAVDVVEILVVRKRGEVAHHDSVFSGADPAICKHIIVDDFISSGNTMDRVYRRFLEGNPGFEGVDGICVGGVVSDYCTRNMKVDTIICGKYHSDEMPF